MPNDHRPAPVPHCDPSLRSLRSLDALNLFLADVRDGLGPYLAIYLLAVRGPERGWNEATVGVVMTIAGIVGLLAQVPAGGLIDRSRNKRTIVIVAAVAVTMSCLSLPFVGGFAMVAATQSIAAVAGAVLAPALSAITLGPVGPKLFAPRVERNILAAQLLMTPVAIVVGRKADHWGASRSSSSASQCWRRAVPLHGVGRQLVAGGGASARRNRRGGVRRAVSGGDRRPGAGPDCSTYRRAWSRRCRGWVRAFSATLAGVIIAWEGYSVAFMTLSAIAGVGFVMYLLLMPETKGWSATQ